METEPKKMLGHLNGTQVEAADFQISAHCNRVPVREGHTECVSLQLEERATVEEILQAWTTFQGLPQRLALPTAPAQFIAFRTEEDYPQPASDVDAGQGMTTTVGRLRSCDLLDWKFVLVSHNTLRGAAGGSVLNAELAVAQGYLGRTFEFVRQVEPV